MSSRDDDYPYPEDEFDALGADRAPLGAHRAPMPRWRQLLPFLIVLVLAPTLAFVAVRVWSGGGGDPSGGDPSQTTAAETSTESTGAETEEPTSQEPTSEETTTEAATTEDPTGDLDMSIQIWVLNGSGVAGLAADTVAVLESAGWQDANAADYGSSVPSSTTIFYDNADQGDEAQAIGDELGVSTLVESSDAADGDIVLVLRSDFALP